MSEEFEVPLERSDDRHFAFHCPTCAHVTKIETSDLPVVVDSKDSAKTGHRHEVLEVKSLKKKDGGFVITGTISPVMCGSCGAVVSALAVEVPVELEHLKCSCGGSKFSISLKSVEKEKKKIDPNWQFEVDINCERCHKIRFREKIASLFRLKRLKVGPTGVDIQLK
jgi:hypothetical protein